MYVLLVSLLLWHKMVAMHRFVWPLALRLPSASRQAGRRQLSLWLNSAHAIIIAAVARYKTHGNLLCYHGYASALLLFASPSLHPMACIRVL